MTSATLLTSEGAVELVRCTSAGKSVELRGRFCALPLLVPVVVRLLRVGGRLHPGPDGPIAIAVTNHTTPTARSSACPE